GSMTLVFLMSQISQSEELRQNSHWINISSPTLLLTGVLKPRLGAYQFSPSSVVGDASPLMWSSEDRRVGEGGAQRDGARRARSLVCAAMPDCSPRISTMVNY
ncbi:hypothetical protein KUCAC02_012845, partial [Chaenocephalus aceratus]